MAKVAVVKCTPETSFNDVERGMSFADFDKKLSLERIDYQTEFELVEIFSKKIFVSPRICCLFTNFLTNTNL